MEGKVVDRARAAERARLLREQDRRAVFTNGCFDILHEGHLHLLREARALGDFLFVGLNDDDSVRRLKGKGRPVNPLAVRARALAEVPYVDLVVPFPEDTPLELIRAIQPDVLVKGGDYAEEEVVGGDVVRGCGGRVVIIPLLPGFSTTGIIGDQGEE